MPFVIDLTASTSSSLTVPSSPLRSPSNCAAAAAAASDAGPVNPEYEAFKRSWRQRVEINSSFTCSSPHSHSAEMTNANEGTAKRPKRIPSSPLVLSAESSPVSVTTAASAGTARRSPRLLSKLASRSFSAAASRSPLHPLSPIARANRLLGEISDSLAKLSQSPPAATAAAASPNRPDSSPLCRRLSSSSSICSNLTVSPVKPANARNRNDFISAVRLHMTKSMHEKYFAELERRFAGRNMSACLQASRIIGFKAGRSRSSLECGCFRWSLHPSSGLLSNRLVVVDAESVWDDFVVKERFRDLLQPFSGVDGCVVYLCNWKRAANRHTAQLNRLFRQAVMQDTTGTGIGTPSKQQRITKTAADLENEFFLEAVDLGVKVNFSTAATEAQGLVELMDFVLEMTRVVAKNAWDCVTNRLATTAAAQNCRLTLPPDTKVKCGKDALDCWHRMLCQIPRITPPVADALVKHFPTFKSLMRAVNACSCDEDGQRLFQDLRLHEGEGKRLGPSLALRLYRYFKQ